MDVDFAISVSIFILLMVFISLYAFNYIQSFSTISKISEYRRLAKQVYEELIEKKGMENEGLISEPGVKTNLYRLPLVVESSVEGNFVLKKHVVVDNNCNLIAWNTTLRIYDDSMRSYEMVIKNPVYCSDGFVKEFDAVFLVNLSSNSKKVLYLYFSNDTGILPTSNKFSSLLTYLPFDEGSGNYAYDYSGYNNTGVLYNGSTVCNGNDCPNWVAGKFGKAIKFDGSNDWIKIDVSGLGNGISKVTRGKKDYTLSAWVKLSSVSITSGSNTILGSTYHYWNRFDIENGNSLCYGIYNSTISNGWVRCKSYSFEAEKWYFVALVYDQTNDKMKWYVNDNSIGSDINLLDPSRGIYIVGATSSNYDVFNGTIDEVMIWNKALSDEEVKAMYYLTLKKIIDKYGVESVSLPSPVNVSLALASPYQAYFDNIVVEGGKRRIKLFVPFNNIDLQGDFKATSGTSQVIVQNMGYNTTLNKPIVRVSSE